MFTLHWNNLFIQTISVHVYTIYTSIFLAVFSPLCVLVCVCRCLLLCICRYVLLITHKCLECSASVWRFFRSPHDHRLEDVELEVSVASSDGDGHMIPEHLSRHHSQRLTLRGVHLPWDTHTHTREQRHSSGVVCDSLQLLRIKYNGKQTQNTLCV